MNFNQLLGLDMQIIKTEFEKCDIMSGFRTNELVKHLNTLIE